MQPFFHFQTSTSIIFIMELDEFVLSVRQFLFHFFFFWPRTCFFVDKNLHIRWQDFGNFVTYFFEDFESIFEEIPIFYVDFWGLEKEFMTGNSTGDSSEKTHLISEFWYFYDIYFFENFESIFEEILEQRLSQWMLSLSFYGPVARPVAILAKHTASIGQDVSNKYSITPVREIQAEI